MKRETKINLTVSMVIVVSAIVFITIQLGDSMGSFLSQFDSSCSINNIDNCSVDEARELVQETVDELNLKTDKSYYILEK